MMTRSSCIVLALVTAAAAAAAPAAAEGRRPAKARGEESARADEGRVGRVGRTSVAARERKKRSGFSGKRREDAVKLTIDIDRVRGFDDPRTKATCTLDLSKGDVVLMLGRGHEGWLLVETNAGDVGWIPAGVVADKGRFLSDPRQDPAPEAQAEASAEAPRRTKKRAKKARGPAAAVASIATAALEAGAEPAEETPAVVAVPRAAAPAPSRVAASLVATAGAETFALRQAGAMAIASGPLGAIAAAARVHVAGQLWVGVAGDAGISTGELTYYDTTATSQPMATRDVVIDANAELGWGRAWSVAARAGYHHAALDVESERTEPMLIGDRIRGATVGVRASAPITRRLAFAAAIDVMPAGDHAPAEAGVAAASAVRGAWARGTLTVRLPARLLAALAYRGGAVDLQLSDGTIRNDRIHGVTAGLGVTW